MKINNYKALFLANIFLIPVLLFFQNCSGSNFESTKNASSSSNSVFTILFSSALPTTTNSLTLNFSVQPQDNNLDLTYECQLNELDFEVCDATDSIIAPREGSHTFRIRGIDTDGEYSNLLSHSWTVNLSSNPPSLTTGEWVQISNSKLRALNPCPVENCNYSGVTKFKSVMLAWSGAVYDSTQDGLVVWGGGHDDYYGNEAYRFNIQTQTWQALTNPAPFAATIAMEANGTYPDGTPLARHTYNNLVYSKSENAMYTMGAYGISKSGTGNEQVWKLSLNTNTWSQKTSLAGGSYIGAGYTAINNTTGKIYYHKNGNGVFAEYDPNTDTHTVLTQKALGIYTTAAVDTSRNKMMVLGGTTNSSYVWDLNQSPPTLTNFSSSISASNAVGLDYDVENDVYVAWANSGKTVYIYDPVTFAETAYTPAAGATPTTAPSQGTFGRFRYVPSLKSFILVNSVDHDVFMLKLN